MKRTHFNRLKHGKQNKHSWYEDEKFTEVNWLSKDFNWVFKVDQILKHRKMEEKMILGKIKGSTMVFIGMVAVGIYLIVIALTV
ncbi:hypothetical protein [Maribacter polysaccharolyticus]|uniref:hypothetical protein n=1 Tax=Maribacter polysaccharolyticus TaxID=3020831 RepID=UPI00237F76E9|nr:hypothetical protein [Maribacter polysaccharolyticus]MDE3742349.1 hypothetical protein [Maribacter polysaccharolyticus]